MTQHAVFCYRRVLVRKWTAILRVTAQAEFIDVRAAQVLSQRTAVRIVTIDAGDLALAIRVMVRQTPLRSLRLVALEAGVVGLSARTDRDAAFGTDLLDHSETTACRGVQRPDSLCGGLPVLRVHLMTVSAAYLVYVM
jgi:hypothetical protein